MLTILTHLGFLPPATDSDLEAVNLKYERTWHASFEGLPPAREMSSETFWVCLITAIVVFGGSSLVFYMGWWPGVA